MLFLLWCLAVVGLTHIVVDSNLVWRLKHWLFYTKAEDGLPKMREDLTTVQKEAHYMLNCYQCSGFWAGMLLGVVMNPLAGATWPFFLWLLYAFAGSYLPVVGAALLNYLESGK